MISRATGNSILRLVLLKYLLHQDLARDPLNKTLLCPPPPPAGWSLPSYALYGLQWPFTIALNYFRPYLPLLVNTVCPFLLGLDLISALDFPVSHSSCFSQFDTTGKWSPDPWPQHALTNWLVIFLPSWILAVPWGGLILLPTVISHVTVHSLAVSSILYTS